MTDTKVLTLAVKAEYFDQIKRGEKTEEYRERKHYWVRRLHSNDYTHIVITKGYPKKDDLSRRMVFPYNGYVEKTIEHPHFDGAVDVYAIQLKARGEQS